MNVKRELEKIVYQKVTIEERLVAGLQEQMLNNKENQYLFKILRKTKERTRELVCIVHIFFTINHLQLFCFFRKSH